MAESKFCLGRPCPTPQHVLLPAKYSCHYCHLRVSAQHCCANPAGQEALRRGCGLRIGNSHLQQPMEVRAAGCAPAVCQACGLTLTVAPVPSSQQPWVSRRKPRLKVASGHFRAGQGCAHIPSSSLEPSCCLLDCVC